MIKKVSTGFISILLVFVFIFSLCACEATEKEDELKSSASDNEVKTSKLAIETSLQSYNEYGNLNLDITKEDFYKAGFKLGDSLKIVIDDENDIEKNDVPFFNGYYGKYGRLMVVAYPTEEQPNIMIASNCFGIKNLIDTKPGTKVYIMLSERGKYLSEQKMADIKYSNNREDFKSDEVFANAREIKAGKLKPKTLYRSASPFNNVNNRTEYVSRYAEKVGINTVMNLADTEEKVKDKYYNELPEYSKKLVDSGSVVYAKMDSDYRGVKFQKTMVEAFRKTFKKDGPYLIHCLEGKDRTGYICALLEALAGATYEEIEKDYMETYKNYYGITKLKTPEKYEYNLTSKLDDFMDMICSETDDPKTADLKKCAEEFLANLGMKADEIKAIQNKICK